MTLGIKKCMSLCAGTQEIVKSGLVTINNLTNQPVATGDT